MFAAEYPQAMSFLQKRLLRHLVHLKFLHLYPGAISGTCHEIDGEIGLMLQHPTATRERDMLDYPDTDLIFLPVATNEMLAHKLADDVLQQPLSPQPKVFKFCDPLTRDIFVAAFRLQYANTVISYTITPSQNQLAADDAMIASSVLDDACASLYCRNGYSRDELDHYFAEGAMSFSIYDDGQPLCSCMVYRNFGDVWEIAGLHTVERARRKGYGRRVVQAALDHLLARGFTPRYQVEAANLPSIGLAESLGMNCCLRFEHFRSPAGL